jgi:hypothetical protein
MKCQIFTSLRVLSAVGMLCLTTAARAQSSSFSAATPTASFGPSFYETVALPRFDPSLGTLDSISLRLDAVGTTTGWGWNVFNPALFQQPAYGLVSGNLRLLRPDNSELVFLGHASPWTLLGALPPTSTTPVLIQVPDSTATMLLTNPGDLSLFTGTDTIALPVGGFGYPFMSLNTLEIVSATPQTGFGRVTVTYAFTAIPEPSGIALLALATPGVACLLQRRSEKPRRVDFATPAGLGNTAEPCASPNVGPATPSGHSGVSEGPPSVS